VREVLPQFEAVVWVTDRPDPDKPAMGTTQLKTVLDAIAETLGYRTYITSDVDREKTEVERLLRSIKVLVVVDNFESIKDAKLLSWLLRIPAPSKSIITTRRPKHDFWYASIPVDLKEMTEKEAEKLIKDHVEILKLGTIALEVEGQNQIKQLIAATGCNPLAIKLSLGQIKHEKRKLSDVLCDLEKAQSSIFEYIFGNYKNILTMNEWQVLFALTLFGYSFSPKTLIATTGLTGNSFNEASRRLIEMCLIEAKRLEENDLSSEVHYTLHQIVRSFARNEMAKFSERDNIDDEKDLRNQAIKWYRELVKSVGYCWQDASKLEFLDNEKKVIFELIQWAYKNSLWQLVLDLTGNVSYFYFIRGFWEQGIQNEQMRIRAAREVMPSNHNEEGRSMARLIDILDKRGDTEQSEIWVSRLITLMSKGVIQPEVKTDCHHSLYLHYRRIYQQQGVEADNSEFFVKAKRELEDAIKIVTTLLQDNLEDKINADWRIDLEKRLENYHYGLGYLAFLKGDLGQAKKLFTQSYNESRELRYVRGELNSQLRLIHIELKETSDGDTKTLKKLYNLLHEMERTAKNNKDEENVAQIWQVLVQVYEKTGELERVIPALIHTKNLFERLGMRRQKELVDDKLKKYTEENDN
jgi:DNA-binding MarR family transcriptional regulator